MENEWVGDVDKVTGIIRIVFENTKKNCKEYSVEDIMTKYPEIKQSDVENSLKILLAEELIFEKEGKYTFNKALKSPNEPVFPFITDEVTEKIFWMLHYFFYADDNTDDVSIKGKYTKEDIIAKLPGTEILLIDSALKILIKEKEVIKKTYNDKEYYFYDDEKEHNEAEGKLLTENYQKATDARNRAY
jgi:hypothetical protein